MTATTTNPTAPPVPTTETIPTPATSGKLSAGSVIGSRSLLSITGERVQVPDPDHLIHLQFRRFAGCPVCNLHLRSVARRHDEIKAANVREIVVFHSSEDDLRHYEADLLPFAVVADPRKQLYREFGVEPSLRSMLSPRAWLPITRAVLATVVAIVRRGQPVPPLFPDGGRYGLPADLLIRSDGQVVACKYGEHASDQWSVDELLSQVRMG